MSKTRRIAMDGMLAALYFALSMLMQTTQTMQYFRFTSLALILAALLFTAADACAVALVGEFLYQLLFSGYGLSVSTLIWLLPPVLHALLLGVGAALVRRLVPEKRQIPVYFLVCILCGVLNIGFNTAALWADSVIVGYQAALFAMLPWRLIVGVLTAALTCAVAMPLLQLMQRKR